MLPPNTGAADAQANCVARLAPLAAAFAGDAQLMVAVECATRVTQNSDAAVAWACTGAAVLEALLLKGNRERQGEAVAAPDGCSRPAGPMEGAVRGVMVELQKGVGECLCIKTRSCGGGRRGLHIRTRLYLGTKLVVFLTSDWKFAGFRLQGGG